MTPQRHYVSNGANYHPNYTFLRANHVYHEHASLLI